MSSCNTLEPTYVDENWQKPGGSDSEMDEWVSSKHSHTILCHCHQTFHLNMFSKHREEVGLFDTPQKSRERNPPFSIEIDFTQYRRGRDYTVSILTENYFDAFIMQVGDRCQTQICNQEGVVTTRSNTCSLFLTFGIFQPQARGQERPDGNATLVGEWVKMPGITKHLKCIGTMRSTWVFLQDQDLRTNQLFCLSKGHWQRTPSSSWEHEFYLEGPNNWLWSNHVSCIVHHLLAMTIIIHKWNSLLLKVQSFLL